MYGEVTKRLCSNYSTRYRPELDLVLRELNLTIVRDFKRRTYVVIADVLGIETEREDWHRR